MAYSNLLRAHMDGLKKKDKKSKSKKTKATQWAIDSYILFLGPRLASTTYHGGFNYNHPSPAPYSKLLVGHTTLPTGDCFDIMPFSARYCLNPGHSMPSMETEKEEKGKPRTFYSKGLRLESFYWFNTTKTTNISGLEPSYSELHRLRRNAKRMKEIDEMPFEKCFFFVLR